MDTGHGWNIYNNYKVTKKNMPIQRHVHVWTCGDGCCTEYEWQDDTSNFEIGEIFQVNEIDGDIWQGDSNDSQRVSQFYSCQWYIEQGFIEGIF